MGFAPLNLCFKDHVTPFPHFDMGTYIWYEKVGQIAKHKPEGPNAEVHIGRSQIIPNPSLKDTPIELFDFRLEDISPNSGYLCL